MKVSKVERIAVTPKMVASQPAGEDFVATLLEAMEGEKREVIAQGGMELSQLLLVLPLSVSPDMSFTEANLRSFSEKGFTVGGDYLSTFHKMQEDIPSQLNQLKAEGNELLDLQEEGDPTGLTELFEGNNQKPPEAFQAESARKSQRLLKDAELLQKEFESLQKDAEPKREGGLRKPEGQEGDKEGYAFYQQTPEKASAVEEKQEVRTEVVRRQPIVNQEHRHLSMRLEEANIRMNLLGDRLRLYINMAEEAYRQPTALEVQRLVQSLQNLGYNLEVLKLNGNSLYNSDHRQGGRRDEREKEAVSFSKSVSNDFESEVKSFSLYM
ncbi:MAG: hypothetical protein NZM36_06530 [Aquificaceae bacterium]|nr:hypothetical protein [Aquificaceae bacterium]